MEKELAPAFQEYPADIQSDENYVLMDMDERGLWWTLRKFAWRQKSIPKDVTLLARLCHLPQDRFDRLWLMVSRVFVDHPSDPHRLVEPYLEAERLKQAERRESNSKAGKASAEARAAKKAGTDPPEVDDEAEQQKFLYNEGAAFLTTFTPAKGKPLTDKNARSFIGSLCRLYPKAAVVNALQRAMAEKPLNPIEFMKGSCETFVGNRNGNSRAGRSQSAADEALKENGGK